MSDSVGNIVPALSTLSTNTKVKAITVSDNASNILNSLSTFNAATKVTSLLVSDSVGNIVPALSTLSANAKVTAISVSDNARNILNSLSTFNATTKVTSLLVSDSAANLATNLNALQTAGAKLTAITQTDTGPLTITSAQLTADAGALAKISGNYSLNVTGVALTDAVTVLGKLHVTSIAISDTAAHISSQLDYLASHQSVISSIALTDKNPIALTEAQLTSDAGVLALITSPYNLAVTNVAAADVAAVLGNLHVTSIAISDTAAHISSQLDFLAAHQSVISSIALTDKNPIALTEAQLTSDAGVLALITSPYNLAVTNVAAADVASVLGNPNVVAVSVVDSGADILSNLALLNANLGKIESLTSIGHSNVISLSCAEYYAYEPVIIASRSCFITNINDIAENIAKYWPHLASNGNIDSVTVSNGDVVNLSEADFIFTQGYLSEIITTNNSNTNGFLGSHVDPANFLIGIVDAKAGDVATLLGSSGDHDHSSIINAGGDGSTSSSNPVYISFHASIVSVVDAAINITSNLDTLESFKSQITSITLSDADPITASVAQLSYDADVLAKITNLTSIIVSDTSHNIAENIDFLHENLAKIALITRSDASSLMNITAAQYKNDADVLAKIAASPLPSSIHVDTVAGGLTLLDPIIYGGKTYVYVQPDNPALPDTNTMVQSQLNAIFNHGALVTESTNTAQIGGYTLTLPTATAVQDLMLHGNVLAQGWPQAGWYSSTPGGYDDYHVDYGSFQIYADITPDVTHSVLFEIQGSPAYLNVTDVAVTDVSSLLASNSVAHITILDTAADIAANLDTLEQYHSLITSITVTDSNNLISIPSAQFVADQDALKLLTNYHFAAYSAAPATYQAPDSGALPMTIQGNASVTNWVVTTTSTFNGASTSSTIVFHQDNSGGNITFNPSIGYIQPGYAYTVTAQGVDGSGNNVATGALSFTPGFSSVLNTDGLHFNSALTVQGISLSATEPAPSATAATLYFVTGNYTVADVSLALQNNASLLALANSGQLALAGASLTAIPLGYNPAIANVLVNGLSLPVVGTPVGSYTPVAIYSPVDTTVQVHAFNNGSVIVDQVQLSAGVAVNLNTWDFLGGTFVTNNTGLATATQIYFTDTNGAAIDGLKVAHIPLSGGLLTSPNFISVGSTLATAVTVYTGTVTQVLASAATAPAGGLFAIKDTIFNISAGGQALYNLEASGALLGALPTDGFAPIPLSSSSGYTPIAVSAGAGHIDYVDTLGSGGPQIKHAVLAIQASSANANVSIFIDNTPITSGLVTSSGGMSLVNGIVGIALPNFNSSSLSGLKALVNNDYHTLNVSNATIGIVPPGGGQPSSFASSQSIWIGDAAYLPTSISNLHANTLYIVSDSPANIMGLDLNQGNNASGVVNLLASEGLIAYSPTGGFNLYSLLETSMNTAPIANVAAMSSYDSAYDAEVGLVGNNSLGLGDTLYINDGISRLLSPGLIDIATTAASGIATTGNFKGSVNLSAYGPGLNSAFSAYKNVSHIEWFGALDVLTSASNQTAIGNVYTSAYQLNGVRIGDTIANLAQVNSSEVSGLISFIKTHASSRLYVDIRDTVANLESIFGSPAASTAFVGALNAVLGPNHTGISYTIGVMEVSDTVANVEAALANGQLPALQAGVSSMLSGPGVSNNSIPSLRLIDTIDNINTFLSNQQDAALWPLVGTIVVEDTAINLAAGFANPTNGNTWTSAVVHANNFWVKDSFANIQSHASALFAGGYEVNKVLFTDISGATGPLVVGAQYSAHGQLPMFDFTNATGFIGNVTASESQITGGEEITVSDQYGHQVVIDVMTNTSDANHSELYSVVLPAETVNVSQLTSLPSVWPFSPVNITDTATNINSQLGIVQADIASGLANDLINLSGMNLVSGNGVSTLDGSNGNTEFTFTTASAAPSNGNETASISHWQVGDAIQYSSILKAVAATTPAVQGTAAIDGATGLANFVLADHTVDQQLLAVEKALSLSAPGAGHFAKWDNDGNTYVLITDGHSGATVGAGDDLIKIVGADSSHVQLVGGVVVAH